MDSNQVKLLKGLMTIGVSEPEHTHTHTHIHSAANVKRHGFGEDQFGSVVPFFSVAGAPI